MFPLLYSRPDIIQDNILEIWQQRTYKDYSEGKVWYKEANQFSKDLAEKYEIAPVITAGVISALSPQKEWNVNKALADDFLKRCKTTSTTWKHAGHYLKQKRKARRIFNMDNPFVDEIANELHGLKTVNFFHCIQNPATSDHVCIDRHMIMVALGKEKKKLTVKQYSFLKQEFLKFAKKVNLKPAESQGILWLTYKRVKKI